MNKTISINISGIVFNIEESAYNRLSQYLDTIRAYFDNMEGADEIMNDIELRIAELFQERLGDQREVVTNDDVAHAESVMGKPSDIAEGADEEESSGSSSRNYESTNQNKKVYRDPDNNVIGGVAAGISNYFGWDPLWVRILFVILALSGGFGVPIYILLWIIIPEARTTAEKLRMHGQKINVENIKKKVSEEMDGLKDSFQDISERTKKNVSSNSFKNFMESLFKGIGSLLSAIGRFLVKVVGVLLFFLGIGLFIGAFAIFLVNESFLNIAISELNFEQLGEFFYLSKVNLWFFIIGTILLFLTPMVACFYGGYRILVNGKAHVPGMGLTLFSLFLLGIVITSIAGVRYGREMSNEGNVRSTTEMPIAMDTLYIKVNEDTYFHNSLLIDDSNILTALHKEEETVINGYGVGLYFYSTDSPEFRIEIDKSSNGLKETTAVDYADQIDFDYEIRDSLLSVDPFIKMPYKNGFRFQEVSVRVYVPEGKTVYMDENIGRIYRREYRGGKFWHMEDEEFVRTPKRKPSRSAASQEAI
jgi:phage shock protein PspC (stress-responsive transcriptional regulator)